MHSGTRNVKIVEEKPLYCCLPLGETVKCGWGGGGGKEKDLKQKKWRVRSETLCDKRGETRGITDG